MRNAFAPHTPLTLHLYAHTQPAIHNFSHATPLWKLPFTYDYNATDTTLNVNLPVTQSLVHHNASLYAFAFVTRAGASPDPADHTYDKRAVTSAVTSLVGYDKRNEPLGLRNLLTGEPAPWEAVLRDGLDDDRRAGRAGQFVAYWKPRMDVQLVIDDNADGGPLPPVYHHELRMRRLASGSSYLPLVTFNDLTVMRQHWMALNSSWLDDGARELPLELAFRPVSLHRFKFLRSLELTMQKNEEALGISQTESEEMRGMFVNTHPYLLWTTVAVSTVHLLFDMLAFKSDIAFWSSVETMEGLSARALVLSQVMELIVLLYLIEQGASWLIQITSAGTLVLGVFKIVTSLRVKRADADKGGGVSITDTYDAIAFRYLLPPLLVLVVAYATYCLLTSYFTSWYAFGLESLVALVYGAGFIVMTPQLFINWKLKSVAHLPWKFFMYKALNTFIDDLFAFIIKMPTLHRLSCFRDDIIFVIFLYQRWVYKVDKSRVNEFGQRGDEGEPGGAPPPAKVAGRRSKKVD